MAKTMTLAAIAAGMLVVSGCGIASEVDALKRMPSKGDAFSHALHMEYAALAGAADARGADDSAEYFYKKGKMAADGKKVDPMGMKERKLPKGIADEIEADHMALVVVLRSGGPKKSPNQMARAQAMFDCVMDETAKEKPSAGEIKACRGAFNESLNRADEATRK